MLDRLLHRSVVFNLTGDSYRLRQHQPDTSPKPPWADSHGAHGERDHCIASGQA